MADYSERRHEPRHAINEEVFDADSGTLLGLTINMNAYGMLMVSKKDYETGSEVRVRINVAPEENDRITLNTLAECRWKSPLPDTNMYQYGFQFRNNNPARLQHYTHTLFDAHTA